MATFVPLLSLGQLIFLLTVCCTLTEVYGQNGNTRGIPPRRPPTGPSCHCDCQPQQCPPCPTVCDNSKIENKCSENLKHLLDTTFMHAEKWGNESKTAVKNYNNQMQQQIRSNAEYSTKSATLIEATKINLQKLREYQNKFEQTVPLKENVPFAFDHRALKEYRNVILQIVATEAILKKIQPSETEQKEKH
ncbi:uncharacterized protein LOC135837380 isoform X2 [Planococcus citri]|uniref:uncharacterized protein LOC135837380 isoform X2 n=1 Tax=Planococcus citri TaxID=170843 RepID=UPI0031F8A9AB